MGQVVQLHVKRPNPLRHLSEQALVNAMLEASIELELVQRRIAVFEAELRRRKSSINNAK